MFNLDHFKKVNDSFGHATGDMVLKKVTETVKKRIRKTDCFARWGGEEFIILLPETFLKDATRLAEELLILLFYGSFFLSINRREFFPFAVL